MQTDLTKQPSLWKHERTLKAIMAFVAITTVYLFTRQ